MTERRIRYRIPNLDLRLTRPLGEPYVASRPTRRREVDGWKVAGNIVRATWITFLLIIAGLTLHLFGPLIGFGIIIVFLSKLKIG